MLLKMFYFYIEKRVEEIKHRSVLLYDTRPQESNIHTTGFGNELSNLKSYGDFFIIFIQ